MTTALQQGFLLTRKQFDYAGKCILELWVKTDTGAQQLIIENETPVCFATHSNKSALNTLIQQQQLTITSKELNLTSFSREPVFGLYSENLKDYHKLRKVAQEHNVELLEDDIKPVDRYLMERFVQGEICFSGQVVNNGEQHLTSLFPHNHKYCRYINTQVKKGSFETNLSALSVDIECDEYGYLYSIGGHISNYDVSPSLNEFVLFNGKNINKPEHLPDCTFWLDSEWEVLLKFCQLVGELDPDLIIGWNFVKFDVRVLVNAAKRNGIKLKLGRDNSELDFQDGNRDGEQRFPDKAYIAGRVVLDGIEVMKNATYSFSSFSLNNVASEVLNEQKLIQESGKDKLAEIKHLYKHDPTTLINYNLQDCILVSKIFEQEKLFEFIMTRTKLTGVELDRVGGSVAAFTNLYLPHTHRKGWVAPNLVAELDYVNSPGGFVMDSIPGIHKDVLVFDFKSLYPSIMRTFNIDPVALLEASEVDVDDRIPGFRGGEFSRDKAILSTILDKLWHARETAKANKNTVFSNAIKIIMNSFYGVLGSSGCRFYDTKLASSITMRGHWVLNQSKQWFENKGLNVIYGDTDSIFVSLDGSNRSVAEASLLANELNAWFTHELLSKFNLENKMEMEFETHFAPFFMPTIRGSESGSKKRYAGMKQHNDGNQELIFKGMETVRSDWTELAKIFQMKLFHLVFAGESTEAYISEIITEMIAGKHDNLLIYKKRIRQHLHSYIKTTPPHIKAARLANSSVHNDVYQKGSNIEYAITLNGPQVFPTSTRLDYEHYVEKQIFPIAEAILNIYAPKVLELFKKQLSLI